MPDRLPAFLSPDINMLRPFNGIHQHDGTVATILLYTGNPPTPSVAEYPERNYLDDLEHSIYSLQSETVGSTDKTPPELPGNKIAVITLDDDPNNRNNYFGVFNNFSLINVSERHEEIVKLHQNFSQGWNAFFFGEKPVVYTFGGIFLDTMEYPYYQEFMVAYQKYLAGRKTIERSMQTKIMYDGKIVDGYMLNINVNGTADVPSSKAFNFSMLIRDIQWVRFNLVPKRSNVLYDTVGYTPKFNAMTNTARLSSTFRSDTLPTDGAGDVVKYNDVG